MQAAMRKGVLSASSRPKVLTLDVHINERNTVIALVKKLRLLSRSIENITDTSAKKSP